MELLWRVLPFVTACCGVMALVKANIEIAKVAKIRLSELLQARYRQRTLRAYGESRAARLVANARRRRRVAAFGAAGWFVAAVGLFTAGHVWLWDLPAPYSYIVYGVGGGVWAVSFVYYWLKGSGDYAPADELDPQLSGED